MLEIYKKFQWKKFILLAIIYSVIANILWTASSFLTMPYYTDPKYFGVWSKIMMPQAGPPPGSFFGWTLLFSFLAGLMIALLYNLIKGNLDQSFWLKVFEFSKIVLGLLLVFSYLPMFLMFNLPLALIIFWFITEIVVVLVNSIIIVKVLK